MAEDGNTAILMELMSPPPGYERQVKEPFEPAGKAIFETSDPLTGARSDAKRARIKAAASRTPGHRPDDARTGSLLTRRVSYGAPDKPITEAVAALDHWPQSAVGRLTASFSGTIRFCTATVVAERVVLTAAHCVMARGEMADWTHFQPQAKSGRSDLGNWAGEAVYVYQGWAAPALGTSQSPYDYAFVRLDRPIAALTGTVSVLAKGETAGAVTSLGYPRVASGAFEFDGRFLYATTGNHLGVSSPSVVEAENEMTEGSSGGPWFAMSESGISVVGLNSTKPLASNTTTFSPVLGDDFLALFARVLSDMTGV